MKNKFNDFKNKYLTQRVRRIVSIVIIVVGVFFFANYALNEPTFINKAIASRLYKEPANVSFVEQNFYNCVIDAYNTETGDSVAYTDSLSDEQLVMITSVSCSGDTDVDTDDISDTTGLEKLIALTNLEISFNKLTKLDISNNTELTVLNVRENSLTELDLSKNTKLSKLLVSNNELTSLDISSNSSLTSIDVSNNKLTELDVSKNEKLEGLYANENNISSLDVSNNQALRVLNVAGNELTELNIDNNLLLEQLIVSGNSLTEVNVSENSELEVLLVDNTGLSEINVSSNTSLIELNVSNNALIDLDTSSNTLLEKLYVSGNKLENIDLDKNEMLKYLSVNNNKISEIDFSKNLELLNLDASNNQLTELDLSGCTSLVELVISGNPFEQKVGTYKDTYLDPKVNTNVVKLPDGFNNNFDSMVAGYAGAEITDNGVKFSNLGNYKLTGTWKFNNDNGYQINYDVYVIEATSDEYVINNDHGYVYINKFIDNETVKKNISVNYGEVVVEDNKVRILYDDQLVREFDLVYLSSDIYEIGGEYIYSSDGYENIEQHIKGINCQYEIDDNKLNVIYNEEIIDTYNLVGISSERYDLSKDYLYYGADDIDKVVDYITVVNASLSVEDNELVLKYGNEEVASYRLLGISSDKYDIGQDYVYYGTDTITNVRNNIVTNGVSLVLDEDKLIVKYNEEEVISYLLIGISSDDYDLNEELIMYSGNLNKIEDIVCNNCMLQVDNENGLLNVMTGDIIIDSYNVVGIGTDYKLGKSTIYVLDDYGNNELILSKIACVGGSCNIDTNTNKLIFKYNGEVIKQYQLTDLEEYISFNDEYVVDESSLIVSGLSVGIDVHSFDNKIVTNLDYRIIDISDNIVTNGIIKTGDRLRVQFADGYSYYKLSVKGDVLGEGKYSKEGAMKVSKHIIDGNVLEDEYLSAADMNSDNVVKMNDVMRIMRELNS